MPLDHDASGVSGYGVINLLFQSTNGQATTSCQTDVHVLTFQTHNDMNDNLLD